MKKPLNIPDVQKWFWTHEWQEGENEADSDIKAGRVKRFNDVSDLIKELNSLDADDRAKNK